MTGTVIPTMSPIDELLDEAIVTLVVLLLSSVIMIPSEGGEVVGGVV